MRGIKELREAVIGINETAIFMAERLRDGVGFDDATAIWDKITNDEEFKKIFIAAYDGWRKIPDEIEDLDLAEGMELASLQLSYLPRYFAAFKKKKKEDEKVS